MNQTIKNLIPKPIKKALYTFLNKKHSSFFFKPFIFHRMSPIGKHFGGERGNPIDRHFIELFLAENKGLIKGNVLEVGDNYYTQKFGSFVTKSDVIHATEGNPCATIVADLTHAPNIPANTFDCIIFTQTFHLIYNLKSTMETLHRILKPGGTLLITVPGISQISRYDMDRWGDLWRFTTLSAQKLSEEFFPNNCILTNSYGNVLVATAFLQGLALHEIPKRALSANDPNYQVVITVKAVKPAATNATN